MTVTFFSIQGRTDDRGRISSCPLQSSSTDHQTNSALLELRQMQPRGWGNHAQISNTPHRTCSTISLYAFLSERAHDLIIPEARSKKLSSVKLTNKDACEKKKK